MTYKKELEFAKTLAFEAGEIMRKYFRSDNLGTIQKADLTSLTDCLTIRQHATMEA